MIKKSVCAALTLALFVLALPIAAALCVLAPAAYFVSRLARPRAEAHELPF